MPSLREAVGPEGPGVLRIDLLVEEPRVVQEGPEETEGLEQQERLWGGDGTVAKYQWMGGTAIFQQPESGYPCTLNKLQSHE